MDYPKTRATELRLTDEYKFTDGDTNTEASLDTADTYNAIIDEIIGVIQAAGLTPTEGQNNQLSQAVNKLGLERAYPVGSIYINADVSTNPAELFGFGTWESFSEGRVLLGASEDDFGQNPDDQDIVFPLGATGGEYYHRLNIDELPSHDHNWAGSDGESNLGASPGSSFRYRGGGENGFSEIRLGGSPVGQTVSKFTTDTGSDHAHYNIQPYIAVNIWKRIA